jgi:hypothetical protein
MVTWDLTQIIAKVRQLTGTPSTAQLSDATIIDYINTYYVYTMPFELKEQINLQPYNFTTKANVDVYPVLAAFQTDEPMAYANGFPLVFYQDRDIFYQDWPQQYTQDQVATSTGTVGPYTGSTQASPVIRGTYFITDGTQVISDSDAPITDELISSGTGGTAYNGILDNFPIQPKSLQITDSVETFSDNGLGVLNGSLGGTGTIVYTTGVWTATFNSAVTPGRDILADYAPLAGTGFLGGNGSGTINYLTGAFSATFNTAVTTGTLIYDNYQAYQPARPQGVLFYNNEFTFRPIPDQVYQITMQGFITQIALDAVANPNQLPLQTEWGQLIAYGASLDIFADRSDLGAYNNFFPLFKRYENVALGRYVEQFENAQSVPRF